MPINAAAKARLIELGEITPQTPQHRGPHPKFDDVVTDMLRNETRELIKTYKTLDAVPDKVILEKMKEVENEVRRLITTGDKTIPQKDGRISYLPMPKRGDLRV